MLVAKLSAFATPLRPLALHSARRPRVSASRPRFAMVTTSAAKRVLVAIGEGSEEIEASTAVDVLRRAGADVTLASVHDTKRVTLSRGMVFEADALVADVADSNWDAVVAPGGMPGATNLSESKPLTELLKRTAGEGGVIAAICAAPAVVLAKHGLLKGKRATCYPARPFVEVMPPRVDEDVVVDGNFVTGTGPATALPWALKVVEVLYSDAALAQKVGSEMLFK